MLDKTTKRLSGSKRKQNKVLTTSVSSFSPNLQKNLKNNYDSQRKLKVIKELFKYVFYI